MSPLTPKSLSKFSITLSFITAANGIPERDCSHQLIPEGRPNPLHVVFCIDKATGRRILFNGDHWLAKVNFEEAYLVRLCSHYFRDLHLHTGHDFLGLEAKGVLFDAAQLSEAIETESMLTHKKGEVYEPVDSLPFLHDSLEFVYL